MKAKYHTVGTVRKSRRKNVETVKKSLKIPKGGNQNP